MPRGIPKAKEQAPVVLAEQPTTDLTVKANGFKYRKVGRPSKNASFSTNGQTPAQTAKQLLEQAKASVQDLHMHMNALDSMLVTILELAKVGDFTSIKSLQNRVTELHEKSLSL